MIEIVEKGPFVGGSMVWRGRGGESVHTIVVKATYELAPLTCPIVDRPLPIAPNDEHDDGGDASASVRVPADLVPWKRSAEVLLVGSAFAPGERPVSSVVARLLVGDVDKALEASAPRRYRPDGTLEEGALAARMPLRFESASRGVDGENPLGVDPTRRDLRGYSPAPTLTPPAFRLGRPEEEVPFIAFGPVPSAWRRQVATLRSADREWLANPISRAVPAGFDADVFQSAPRDQRLAVGLRADERIILENLHKKHARLVTNLPGIAPRAVLLGSREEDVPLVADTLWIDTDEGFLSMTWRGYLSFDRPPPACAVVILPAERGAPAPVATPAAPSVLHVAFRHGSLENTQTDTDPLGIHGFSNPLPFVVPKGPPIDDEETLATKGAALPGIEAAFLQAKTATPAPQLVRQPPPPPRASRPSMPPESVRPPAPPMAPPPAPPMAPPPAPPMAPPLAPPMAPPLAPPMASTPSAGPAPVPAPSLHQPPLQPPPLPASRPAQPSVRPAPLPVPPAPVSSPSLSSPPSLSSSPSPSLSSSPSPSLSGTSVGPAPPPPPSMKERPAAASFDAAFSARAASDAAAARERDKEAPRDRPSKPPPAAEAGLPRRALVDLLAFDEGLPARLRRDPAFAKLLARGTRGFLFPDEAASRGDGEEGKARWDVLRLLSYAAPLELAQVRDVVAASFEDESQLELPVAVVTGELRPSYEEAELLDVAVQVAQPLAGSNKALPPLLKQAEAAMQAKWAPPREVAMNVVRQIEQAVNAAPGLPARYFATQLERGLLEGRKYKRRVLFGGPRLRADLVFPSGVEVPIYLPEKTADLLPMLPSLAVVAVVELRPREDASEASSEALVGLAVGRVVRRAPVK